MQNGKKLVFFTVGVSVLNVLSDKEKERFRNRPVFGKEILKEKVLKTAEGESLVLFERHYGHLTDSDLVILLTSDTQDGIDAAGIIKDTVFKNVNVHIETIEGLNLERYGNEKVSIALINIISKISHWSERFNVLKDEIYIIVTGGYKIMSAFATFAGLLHGFKVLFKPEGAERDKFLELPVIRLLPDIALWRDNFPFFRYLYKNREMPMDKWESLFSTKSKVKELLPFINIGEKGLVTLNLLGKLLNDTAFRYYMDPHLSLGWKRNFVEECYIKYIKPQETVGILMLDIDRFKKVNDEYGHKAGDEVLKQFAQVVNNVISKWEKQNPEFVPEFVRWGGEEFLVIVKANRKSTEEIAKEIRRSIENYEFEIQDLNSRIHNIKKTVSIGVVLFKWIELGDSTKVYFFEEKVKKADALLYKAKESGRNRIVIEGEI